MMLKCESCGGTYEPLQPGGFRYFHACAPVFDADKQRYAERADKRDENILITGVDAKGSAIVAVRSEGKGATEAIAIEDAARAVPA